MKAPGTFRENQRTFQAPASRASFERFANPAVVIEGWYPVCATSDVPPGRTHRAWIGERDIVLYRDRSGTLRAVERACPHLGADLTGGRVVEKGLQCPFHAWCWGAEGACVTGGGVADQRRIRTYAARDRWGLAWVWAGAGAPAYELPEPAPENRSHVLRLPSQRLACHPHVVLGNGLDFSHVVPVHGFRFEEDPGIDLAPPHRLSVDVHARFGPTTLRRLLGLSGRTARWRFTTIGPSLAWVKFHAPTPFELLWAARPLPGGGCATQTLFFLPRWRSLVRALPMMVATTWADRRVLEGVDFRPGFVPADAVFAMFADLIEGMPPW